MLAYGETVSTPGLNLLSAPGNDLVASTALAASGAHIVLFTTGRGTPFACPVPTVKISSNSRLAGKKDNWIDFNAGVVAEGEDLDAAGQRLFAEVGNMREKIIQSMYNYLVNERGLSDEINGIFQRVTEWAETLSSESEAEKIGEELVVLEHAVFFLAANMVLDFISGKEVA